MNNDVNIASRANLYEDLISINNEFKQEISAYYQFHKECIDKLDPKHNFFINKNYLFGLLSNIDHLFSYSLVRVLVAYPGKISKTSLSIDDISSRSNIFDVINDGAEKKANDLAYEKPRVQFSEIAKIFGCKSKIPEELLDVIVEAKATRDIFMHNGGVVNWVYINKVGKLARAKDGDKLKISDEYLAVVKNSIIEFGDWFKNNCIDIYIKDNKANIFRKMWEMTVLEEHIPFDKMWAFHENGGGHRKIEEADWFWSGSERALFDFFLIIFHGHGQAHFIKNDVTYALKRWRGYPEEIVIMSWINNQFHL